MQSITPYAAAQVTNIKLAEAGDSRKVTPQSMYGYARKGTIASNYAVAKDNQNVKVEFDGDDFLRWLRSYLKGEKRTKQDFNALAGQFEI
jgi:hypothetical protein